MSLWKTLSSSDCAEAGPANVIITKVATPSAAIALIDSLCGSRVDLTVELWSGTGGATDVRPGVGSSQKEAAWTRSVVLVKSTSQPFSMNERRRPACGERRCPRSWWRRSISSNISYRANTRPSIGTTPVRKNRDRIGTASRTAGEVPSVR